jgi:hypothetical protein
MQEYIYKRKEQKILNIETVFIKVKKERKKLIVKKEKKISITINKYTYIFF